MGADARTPEELETLLEDAFVLRDPERVAQLYQNAGVLVGMGLEARGPAQIASLATSLWSRDYVYVAEATRVLQARDTALLLGRDTVNVVRRANDGSWRFAISLLSLEPTNRRS